MTENFKLLGEQFDPKKHVPVTADAPEEATEASHDRADIPPPSAYARSAVVRHIRTGQKAVVHRVDLVTRQLRLWYPDRSELPLEQQFDSRLGWQTFDHWVPEITFSPEEVARQEAKKQFALELEAFDADGLQLVTVFCDDADPVKALGKLQALKRVGMVKTAAERGTSPAKPEVMPAEPVKKGK